MTLLDVLKQQQKMISRKIYVAEKFLNFHTLVVQLPFVHYCHYCIVKMKKKARKRSFDTAIQVHAKKGLFLCERLVFVSVCTQTVYTKSIETTVWKFQHFSVTLCSRNFQNVKLRLDFVGIW